MTTRALLRDLCLLLVLTGGLLTVLAQAPAPAPPTCEQSLATQYQSLVTDKLVDGSATTWLMQLQALVSSLRIQRTHYDVKVQQATLAEQQFATVYEHLRLSREREAALQKEVESLRQAAPTPAN